MQDIEGGDHQFAARSQSKILTHRKGRQYQRCSYGEEFIEETYASCSQVSSCCPTIQRRIERIKILDFLSTD